MAAVMLFLRQTTGKTEHYTHFCMPLKPVFTRDCGDGVHFTDEPTGNLDDENKKNIMNIFRHLANEYQKCVIIVTHSKDIANMANQVLIIDGGKLL